MKKIYFFFLVLVSFQLCSLSQAVRLSNNTNLEAGFPINPNKAIFIQQDTDSLWVTDGTPGNTFNLNIPVTLSIGAGFAFWNNKLYFCGSNAANGTELWVTDGTTLGTSMVKDIWAGPDSSHPSNLVVYNNALYFYATTPTYGREFWKSNGTEGGTVLCRDINDGPAGSYNQAMEYSFYNNLLFFSAQLKNGLELWKSDGTTNGTMLVRDINPGAGSSEPHFLRVFNNELFFTADDGTRGRELWKTTGTEAGTTIVKDIFPTLPGSGITGTIELNGKMLFAASAATNNEELWISDGTPGGTNLLKEIETGAAGSTPRVIGGIIINNKLIFPATSTATGRELFVTDGTEGGTTLFKDVIPGPIGSSPEIWLDRNLLSGGADMNHTLYNGKIFFKTDANFMQQLWITDGVPSDANTHLVKDFGLFGIPLSSYFYTQSGLYFGATDLLAAGTEIFKSQGTGATTSLYADINPAMPSSLPFFQFFILNGKVFFTADDGDSGDGNDRDLFVLSGTESPLPLQLLNFAAAAVTDGVQLNWKTATETASKEFELQRSTDGVHFEPIALVKAKGNSNTMTSYDYFDKEAYRQNTNRLYYRIKITDNNLRFNYSPVAQIRLNTVTKGIQLSPNPAKGFVRLTFSSALRQDAQLNIVNSAGQVVKSIPVQLLQGINQQIIPLDNLAPGIYHAELRQQGVTTEAARFVKE